MRVFILMGAPGAGKGTQAGLLASRSGVSHVSTGSLLRREIELGSPVGLNVKQVVESGNLVDDELLFGCVRAHFSRNAGSDSVIVLDGVPRSVSQVGGLDVVLGEFGLEIEKVIVLSAAVEDLVERFAKRWTCSACGAVDSFGSREAAESHQCRTCGKSKTFQRRCDDEPEVIRNRMRIFTEETEPIVSLYEQRGCVVRIDALRPVESVFEDVARATKRN